MLKRLRGLRVQLLLWAVLPLTIIVVAVSAAGIYSHQMAMRSLIAQRNVQLTQVAARLMDERLKLHLRLLESIAARSDVLAGPLDEGEFDRGLFLHDPNDPIYSVRPLNALAKDTYPGEQATDALNVPAQQIGDTHISHPFLDPVTQQQAVLFGAPMADGRILLGLVSFKDLDFPAVMQSAEGGPQGSACLVSQNGVVAYRLDPTRDPNSLGNSAGIPPACEAKEGTTFQIGPGGQELVISYAPLPTAGWGLVVQEPWANSVAPLLRVSEMTPIILVLTLLGALTVIFFGMRNIIQPLQTLEQEARRVARGDVDAIHAPVGGVEEIESLRQTLNQMTIQIRAYQTALRDYLSALTHAEEDERRHVARELHDDTVQTIVALIQRLEVCERADSQTELSCRLDDVRDLASKSLDSVRRLIYNLRPLYLEDLGLATAAEALCKDVERSMGAPHIQLSISGVQTRLASDLELTAFRILQEALTNVLRHAKAHSVQVRLEFGEHNLTLTVQDDGRGFVTSTSAQDLARDGHFGLMGMRERALRFGGHLSLQSQPGYGTTLMVSLPSEHEPRSAPAAPYAAESFPKPTSLIG
jgi:two-component system, NarL family, sensor histidine kinase UhpB